jgi:hypothetical protein
MGGCGQSIVGGPRSIVNDQLSIVSDLESVKTPFTGVSKRRNPQLLKKATTGTGGGPTLTK